MTVLDLDKQILSYASVFGMIEELQLQGTQFSWLGSIFYVGQLVAEFPAMYLMSRLSLAKFVACTVYGRALNPQFRDQELTEHRVVWGGVCMVRSLNHTKRYKGPSLSVSSVWQQQRASHHSWEFALR